MLARHVTRVIFFSSKSKTRQILHNICYSRQRNKLFCTYICLLLFHARLFKKIYLFPSSRLIELTGRLFQNNIMFAK